MSKYISGVILYDETIRQEAADGTPLVKLIEKAGSLPGIKVDSGTKPLALLPGEVITEGLDGLRERLVEYRGLGAKFAKWRAVIDIGAGIPSYNAIMTNANALARYAALCQERDDRADRRAGSAHGRRPRRRRAAPRSPNGCSRRYSSSSTINASRSRAWCSSRTWSCPARNPLSAPRSRKSPRRQCAAQSCVPASVPGIAFLSRRTIRRGSNRASRRHQQARPAALARHLLVRPRAAGRTAKGLGRQT